MGHSIHSLAATAIALAGVLFPANTHAEGAALAVGQADPGPRHIALAPPPPRPPAVTLLPSGNRDVVIEETTVPNRGLIVSGVFTLGASYTASIIAAASSERAEDNHLYVPVAGPWMDLASRSGCRGDCDRETTNKVLLVASGIFQGIGALQIASGFAFPVKRAVTTTAAAAPTIQVGPAVGNGSYGISASGHF